MEFPLPTNFSIDEFPVRETLHKSRHSCLEVVPEIRTRR